MPIKTQRRHITEVIRNELIFTETNLCHVYTCKDKNELLDLVIYLSLLENNLNFYLPDSDEFRITYRVFRQIVEDFVLERPAKIVISKSGYCMADVHLVTTQFRYLDGTYDQVRYLEFEDNYWKSVEDKYFDHRIRLNAILSEKLDLQGTWILAYQPDTDNIVPYQVKNYQLGVPTFTTKEDVEELIAKLDKKELMEYYFEMEGKDEYGKGQFK